MIFGLIFLAIVILGLIVYFMLDFWVSFLAVFLCSLIAICTAYGVIDFALFLIALFCSNIIMVIISIVIEIIDGIRR